MDNAITDLLDAIVPELSSFLSNLHFYLGLAMLLGPVLCMAFGAFYFFKPPAEANRKAGYRTYFGMGSVAAWRYTQRLAGMVWGIVGAALLIVGIVGCIISGSQAPESSVMTALVIGIIELVCAIGALLFVEITVAAHFDANGNLRKN